MFSGVAMFLLSYIFGTQTWVYSAIMTYVFWGGVAVFIGMFIFGVGVLPVAILASLLNGEWVILGNLLFGVFLTFGSRFLGIYLIGKAEQQEATEGGTETNIISHDLENNIADAEVIDDEASEAMRKIHYSKEDLEELDEMADEFVGALNKGSGEGKDHDELIITNAEALEDTNDAVSVKFCSSCGEKIISSASFCKFCGNKLI
jgi:hypothetical protein